MVQQALVVGHHQHGAFGTAHGVDAFGDDSERVNVETRVGLVEDGELRFENCHLQDFVSLLFSTRKSFIHRTVHQLFVHIQQLQLLAEHGEKIHRIHFLLATRFTDGV